MTGRWGMLGAIALLLAGSVTTAGERQPAPRSFRVPGAYEPKGGKIAWREAFQTEARPGWVWIPAGWVRLSQGWGFQPGFWRAANQPARVPGYTPYRSNTGQRRVTIIMPGPAMPGVRDSGPTVLQGDPDAFAARVTGPILKPDVVNSPGQLSALVDGPIDWRSVDAWRRRMTSQVSGMMGGGSAGLVGRPGGLGTGQPPALTATGAPLTAMSPSYYVGNSLPGTSYPSLVPSGTGVPGQATYIGNALPGTSYPSLTPAPAGIPGQSYYIGGDLPGTTYPSLVPSAGQSQNGYGYGTAPPGNTAGQAGGASGP